MTARNVEQEFDALKADLARLSGDLGGLTEAVRTLIGQDADAYISKFRTAMGHANMTEAVDVATARARDGATYVTGQVRNHPLTTILACFGLGVVLGKLMDR